MTCIEFSKYLDDYITDNLSEDLTIQMREHINNCEKCHAEYEFSKKIINSLHNMDKIEVSDDFLDKLNKRIDTQNSSDKKLLEFPVKKFFNINSSGMKFLTGIAAAAIFIVVAAQIDMPDIGKKSDEFSPVQKSVSTGISGNSDNSEPAQTEEYSGSSDSEQYQTSEIMENNTENAEQKTDNNSSENITDTKKKTNITENTNDSSLSSNKSIQNDKDTNNTASVKSKSDIYLNPENKQKNTNEEKYSDTSKNTNETQTNVQIDTQTETSAENTADDGYDLASVPETTALENIPDDNIYSRSVSLANPLSDDSEITNDDGFTESDLSENNSGDLNDKSLQNAPAPAALTSPTGSSLSSGSSDNSAKYNNGSSSDSSAYDSENNKSNSSRPYSGSGGGGGGSSATSEKIRTPQYTLSVSDISAAKKILKKYSQSSDGSNYTIYRTDLSKIYSALHDKNIDFNIDKNEDNNSDTIIIKLIKTS